MKTIKSNWKNYLFEFLSIFVGVSLAFAMSNWGENQRDAVAETKILTEIKNGLKLDLQDVEENIKGHKKGVKTCNYFRKLIEDPNANQDSAAIQYFYLLRDFISIQNKSGYESLKSKGLGLIKNDSLRFEIISLYDFYYEIIEKLEENYDEMQFNKNYYLEINNLLAEYMDFDKNGNLIKINHPKNLTTKEKKKLLSYLWRIKNNREYILRYYELMMGKLNHLIKSINENT
ncbi:MAG: DUF6090 family protein [Saprospiraceae bacterium]